jgi:hypothetical protein
MDQATWLSQVNEKVLEPDLPICDPHHHLWDHPNSRYLLDELLLDTGSGHNVVSTVFVECASMYRADGPEAMKPVGETEFVNGVAAMTASGGYGPIRVAAGIVSLADLTLGTRVGEVLDAHIAVGLRWHDALEALGTALTIGRERRLAIFEGGGLATMAAAHLGLGNCEKALELAEEAISFCRRRGTRLWEFSALLARIRALRETQGRRATKEIEASLAEAEAWLEMSGAKSYEPLVHIERSELARLTDDEATRQRELREAHRLFLEIGAPIRAAEVARELGL